METCGHGSVMHKKRRDFPKIVDDWADFIPIGIKGSV
jgi:hypothetical protein